MRALKIIVGILGLFVVLPISMYLQFQILKRVDASELMWFLFWINIPAIFLIQVITKIVESINE